MSVSSTICTVTVVTASKGIKQGVSYVIERVNELPPKQRRLVKTLSGAAAAVRSLRVVDRIRESEDVTSEDDFQELESILDECVAAGLPRYRLRWHYRSRHEHLIAFSNLHYYDGNPSQANQKFRESFKKKYGHYPDVIALQGYDAVHVAFKAMKAIDGKVDDPKKFIAALRQVKMSADESPRGPFYFDKYANPVQNIYIKKVVKKDGRLMNEAVKTYTNVSQFGPYADMAEKYMAAPATTRDYPPGDKAAYFKEIEKYFGKGYVEKLKKNNGWVD